MALSFEVVSDRQVTASTLAFQLNRSPASTFAFQGGRGGAWRQSVPPPNLHCDLECDRKIKRVD